MLTAILGCWLCIYQELRIGWTPGGLTATERGIRLRIHEQREPYRIADLAFDGTSWRHVIPADWKEARQRPSTRGLALKECLRSIRYEPLPREQAVALRPHLRVGHSAEEAPATCVQADGKLWFGLGFYEGEGMDGVGGIGMYDPVTKRLEIRRPAWIRDKSVTSIAHDGRFLWLAVHQQYEGTTSGHGLVRYDWPGDELVPMRGLDAPCGVTVNDLLLDRGTLWVSADTLSRRDLPTGAWTHFVLSGDGARLTETSCRAWYAKVLDAAARAWRGPCQPVCNGDSAPEDVARADPDFARSHLLTRTSLHWSESKALGSVLRNFEELQAALGKAKDPESRRQLLIAFSETKNRDPRWRDLALAEMRVHGHDLEILRRFRGDGRVFAFLSELALGGKGWDRERAIEILPWIDAERAKPVLRKLLQSGDGDVLAEAIVAMERASHLRIEADGTRTRLAPDSDTPEYADEEFGAFSRPARDVELLTRIAAQWLAQ